MRTVLLVYILTCAAITSCATSASSVRPSLGEIVGAVDVRRVLECAGKPTALDKARCLGAAAMTAGLQLALDKAADLGRTAIASLGGAGAEVDEDELALQLDEALATVASEVAAAQ